MIWLLLIAWFALAVAGDSPFANILADYWALILFVLVLLFMGELT